MTYEQMFETIAALRRPALYMRKPGDWYVLCALEILKHGSVVLRSACGDGRTPESAVLHYWLEITEIGPKDTLVFWDDDRVRTHARWNGYRWECRQVGERPTP